MALFRKLFYRKPPDRLLEISDRVYVFDCCFSSEHLEENEFKDYMNNILVQLQSYFPDASLTVFNFRDGEGRNLVAEILSRYNIGVIEYPHGYHGCPLLPLGMVYQFLRFCDNWLSSEGKQNVLLMHCEIGGWPVLSFMLACLMLYRSQYSGEERTLEMMYKQAPRELLQMFSPLNPFPSHVRYLHYITGKDNGLQWPLCDVPYSLDCLILQDAPYFDGKAGFRPIVRVYGRDPSNLVDESCQVLFASLENKEKVHNSRQAGRAHITLDIHCNIQGDVVLECILMNEHLELEEMMFRIMFNTRFVQNNVLLLNSEEIDIIWGMEDQFTKNFKAEVIFSEFDVGSNTPKVTAMEKDEVEAEEFFEAEEIFSNPDLHDGGTRDLDFNSTPIKVHDSILPELVSDHDDTANSSLEFDHTIHNLRNGPAQAKLILDDPTALSEMVKERWQVASHDYEAQRLDNENSDMIVETHIQDSPLVEDNAFITRNLRNFFQNAFNNILDDKKVICSTVSVNEAKGSLEIKLPKHNTETYDIGGQSFQDSSPEFRTPKMVDLSQHTKRIPFLADDGRSLSEINGLNLIEEVDCLINPDIQMAFDGGALGHATCQSEILQADQPEVSCKNEERVKVEFPIGGSVHNGNSSEFGNFNVLYRNEDAKDNHYFETEEHISVSNGLEKTLMRNKEIISCDMAQNFMTPMFCNERRSSENENSYHTIGTDFNTKPIHDSQGQTAQSGNSEIVDWLEHQEISHNCIKDGFVSQNNASFEFSCENQEVHIHKKEHQEQLSATSQKQSTVATSDPVTVAQKGKLLLSASGNEKLAEQPIVIMQSSISKDSEDNHVHLSSFPSTNNGLLPRSSPVASPSPPPSPPLPPPQYIHLPLSSSVSRSNHSSNHLCSLPHREGCRAAAPPSIPSFSKKQSASELLASYLPPLPPIKANSPTKSLLTTTLSHSSFTARKCDFELLASQLTFSPPMDFQHSVKCPMTGCLYSSTLHPVKKLNASNFTNVEISTPFNASHFYYVGSLPPSKSTLQASLSRNQIQGISSTPVAPLPLTVKQPRPKSPNCQQVLNFPSSTPPSSNPSSPSLIETATPLPLSSTPGAISSPMQDYLTLSCKEVPSPSHEASQTPLLASPSFSSAANEGAGTCLAPSFQSSLSCHTRKIPFTALPAATPTVPIPSTPCPFLEANTAPPPPPPPPIPPPTIGFPSTPVTEGCKRAPSLPLSLLGCHGQGSTPPSHGQTSSPPLPPLPSKGPLVAPSPPPPPTVPPPHASTPSPLLASSRGPRSLPTLVGAPPPPSPPLLEGHRVAPSPLPRGFGEAPPLFLPPRGYDGPPSPSQPFPFGSSEILLEPHFPGGHGDAPPPPPPPPPPPSEHHGGAPPPPPPPPLPSEHHGGAPPPPPPPPSEHHGGAPPPPPPPPSEHHGGAPPTPPTPRGGVPPTPPLPMLPGVPSAPPPPPSSGLRGPLPPLGPMIGGRGLGFARAGVPATASKKSSLKPLHWVKVTRAMQGSLWAELQKHADAQSTTEFDIAEIETLFSAIVKKPDSCKTEGRKSFTKSDKVHLIDLRRANNTEIMLTKIKMPLHDMMNAALALDESILDSDQVENLIKFCPTKEDMELLKNYTGDKESLGKCEQLFLELMKVPRVEAKLRVFCFKIQFNSQTADIRKSLYTVDSACEEIRNSNKLKEIMKTILYIGNTLNQGTARGAAVGFRLDSLLKLADTRAANNKTTLMHYLCMVLDSRSPHLMHFHEDFISLEAASKIQLKALAEEQQGVVKGLAKVEKELIASESDGVVSEVFCKTLKDFTAIAGAEVRSLTALYTTVGKNADSLALYFGEDPARCPFEQVIITLLNFVRMFRRAHEENCKETELEKKKALKTADTNGPKKCKFYKETC